MIQGVEAEPAEASSANSDRCRDENPRRIHFPLQLLYILLHQALKVLKAWSHLQLSKSMQGNVLFYGFSGRNESLFLAEAASLRGAVAPARKWKLCSSCFGGATSHTCGMPSATRTAADPPTLPEGRLFAKPWEQGCLPVATHGFAAFHSTCGLSASPRTCTGDLMT